MPLPPDSLLGPVPLTDPVAVAAILGPTLSSGMAPPRLRLRYLEHDVGTSILVWYRAGIGSDGVDVVVSRGRRQWPPLRPDPSGGAPGPAAELRAAGVRQPTADVDGTTVAWYPFDPALPALAADPGAFVPAGPARPDGPWRRLAWMPHQRAVLAAGGVVVKMEAEPDRLRAGVRHLHLLRSVVRTPEVLAVDDGAGVYVQELLAGRPLGPPDAVAWANAAGALAGRIMAAGDSTGGGTGGWPVPRIGPSDLLAATAPVQRLAAHAAPDLAARIERLALRLDASTPRPASATPLHLTHGDFNAGQLVARPRGDLGLVDTDTLCLAPAGQDLATYATNLLAGRAGDLAAADSALAGLLVGYGAPAPHELPWLMAVAALRRLDRPIRRYKANWHERLSRLLTDVETLAARV